MLKENALVIGYEDGIATVKCQSKSVCGSCASKASCGTGALSELTGELKQHIFTISTITPLREGQIVEIGLKESSLLFSIWLIYLVPLFILLASTFLADFLLFKELISALFIFTMTGISFIFIHFYTKKLQKKVNYQPILLRIIR
ncbi:RseC/MucC-like positive regulator of sigma(E) [Bisgaardia hudsonensis]|uniref:RseC/MucC-like positive regulator of sigma(E) n=1 Tax=Bisgaardia hudsonensis TaxID=109472 RepID=A0A4R2MUD3_9PAST|nr:SoxR reducing system RseC family protein [Bisgaardia hudsonensis]QLB12237.1 hypothetical protein A6A11_00695 [Bisgaardia hudsonensis]TCP12280.1 RseC/MucC-like positive regulator of sigma(E) [Bisgaardia hudsonensis]